MRLNLCCLSTIQENAANKGYAGSDQPFAAPSLDRLPINQGIGGIDETRCHCRTDAGYAEDEADHCSNAQPETAAELREVGSAPEALIVASHGSLVLRATAHAAEWGVDYEFRAAVAAQVMTNRWLGFCYCRMRSSSASAGSVSFPVLVIQHWLPVGAFSSQRVGTHGKIPNFVART